MSQSPNRYHLALKRCALAALLVSVTALALGHDPPHADAGSSLSINSVTVEPPAPTEEDPISITVEGTMWMTCPVTSFHSLSKNFIMISVSVPPGSYCLAIPGAFSVTEEIGRLAAGSYQVKAYCGLSPCFGSKTLIVTSSSVGGIAELPEVAETALEAGDSSGPSAGVLAGIAAAAVGGSVALTGAGWYVRRRVARR